MNFEQNFTNSKKPKNDHEKKEELMKELEKVETTMHDVVDQIKSISARLGLSDSPEDQEKKQSLEQKMSALHDLQEAIIKELEAIMNAEPENKME